MKVLNKYFHILAIIFIFLLLWFLRFIFRIFIVQFSWLSKTNFPFPFFFQYHLENFQKQFIFSITSYLSNVIITLFLCLCLSFTTTICDFQRAKRAQLVIFWLFFWLVSMVGFDINGLKHIKKIEKIDFLNIENSCWYYFLWNVAYNPIHPHHFVFVVSLLLNSEKKHPSSSIKLKSKLRTENCLLFVAKKIIWKITKGKEMSEHFKAHKLLNLFNVLRHRMNYS